MECAICLEVIDESTGHLRLPCSHTFHIQCGLRWFQANQTCPCCRSEFEPKDETDELVIRRRMHSINYNEILTETLRIISQPWSLFDAPQELWNVLDPDSQGRQIRVWLVEHMEHVFEREFRLLLRERYLITESAYDVTSDGPIDSDHAVLSIVASGVSCIVCFYVYHLIIYLWAYINGA